MRRSLKMICFGLSIGACLPQHAFAQAAACPPPLKLAAGACVKSCPGGYEDQGRACIYRNLSR